jgi:hypothetical protein
MKKEADISPDNRRGLPRKGWTCAERVKEGKGVPSLPEETEPTEPTETPIRGAQWDLSHNTVGARHASGSRAALDFSAPVPWVPAHRVRSKTRSRTR